MAFTVADYIVRRLAQQQVDTLFGVPAAYCSPLFDAAIRQGMRTVVTASDLEAGYAADGYARTKGLGAASVAYGVGALSMINAIAGAFVERSPVVVVNGGPTPGALSNLHQFDVVPSHSIGQDATDLSAYRLVTASAARAGTVAEVPPLVDAAIASAIRTKRPSYIEINMGIWDSACPMPAGALPVANRPAGTESALAASIVGLIRAAQSPVILVGQEIQRYGLADKVGDLIAKLGVRWATAVLSKSVLAEQGPGWIGVYDPPHSPPAIKNAVEHADFLVTLGAVFPNGYASLVQNAFGRMVEIYDGKVRIKTGAKQNAEIGALVAALVTEAAKAPPKPVPPGATPAAPGPGRGPAHLPTGVRAHRRRPRRHAARHPRHLPRRLFRQRPAGEGARRFSLQRRVGLDRAFGRRRGRCVLRLRAPAARDLRRRRLSHDRDGALHHGAIPPQSDRCRPRQRHLWFRAVFARCLVLQ